MSRHGSQTKLKKYIRKRKRAYKKAKNKQSINLWQKFRHLRNQVIISIRSAKSDYYLRLSDKLKQGTHSGKDWWKPLKTFISDKNCHTIPPLYNMTTN